MFNGIFLTYRMDIKDGTERTCSVAFGSRNGNSRHLHLKSISKSKWNAKLNEESLKAHFLLNYIKFTLYIIY